MATSKIVERDPGVRRRPVLLETVDATVSKLQGKPQTWMLIAHGGMDRHRVISQTAYRIRKGLLRGFESDDGHYDTQVSTDTSIPDRIAPVELYAMWIKK